MQIVQFANARNGCIFSGILDVPKSLQPICYSFIVRALEVRWSMLSRYFITLCRNFLVMIQNVSRGKHLGQYRTMIYHIVMPCMGASGLTTLFDRKPMSCQKQFSMPSLMNLNINYTTYYQLIISIRSILSGKKNFSCAKKKGHCVNKCGAYWRAVHINIFALRCGA